MKKGITITQRFELENVTSVDNLTDAIFTYKENEKEGSKDADYLLIKKMSNEDVTFDDELKKFVLPLSQADTLKLTRIYYIEAQLIYKSGATNKWNIERKSLRPTLRTENVNGQSDGSEVEDIDMTIEDVFVTGGGGTGDYTDLTNKPRINNIELIGNKTDTDLGLATKTELNAKQNVISGGNGIDVSSDVVSVDLYSDGGLKFNDNGLLVIDGTKAGRLLDLRQALADANYSYGLAPYSYVNSQISGRLKRLVVAQLPTDNIDTNTIYMILKTVPSTNNIYDEYMYINNAWELIGSTEVDLSGYQEKLTVGNGIDITNDEISVNVTAYNSILQFINGELWASGSAIASDTSFQSSMPYDTTIRQRLADTSVQNPLQPKLTAGTNITIDSNNVISATGGGLSYTFTDGLKESSGTVGLDIASGSKLLIDANDKLDVDLSSKQDTIDSTHKLSSDLVDDTSATNKFVPTHSSSESGKVLGVDNQGALQWVSQSGGGSYSGGDGIDITNDTISVDIASGSALTITSGELDIDLSNYATTTSVSGKEDKTDITTDTTSTTVSLTLADNHEYRYTQDLTSLTLTMPSGDFISSIVFASGSTPTAMTYDSSIKWSGDDVTNGQFVPSADKDYDICLYYNGLNVNGIVRGV